MSIDILQNKIRKLKTPIMVGLDPTRTLIPPELLADCEARLGVGLEALAEGYCLFCKGILDALKKTVPAVKVQSACFEALGWQGVKVMQEVLAYAKKQGYYVLLETMRSDVEHIAALTAESVFEGLDIGGERTFPYPCDGLVLTGYLGSDGVKPFLPHLQQAEEAACKNLFIVLRSSNRSAVEVQDLLSGDRVIYRAMADLAQRWNTERVGKFGYGELGAVVAAQSPLALQELRKRYDKLFFLVPGLGAQGGAVKHAAYAFDRLGHGAIVCVSRSVIGAWQELACMDYPEAAQKAVEKLKSQLSDHIMVL